MTYFHLGADAETPIMPAAQSASGFATRHFAPPSAADRAFVQSIAKRMSYGEKVAMRELLGR